jgi:DNA-binding MarR family transcriptional regulator
MKTQNETPRFAHLQYAVLKQFKMSPAEYWYLDMIYYLSRDGWCYKSLENIASDMNMTKNGVVKLRDRLIDKGLVIKNRKGQVKSSVMYNKVYLTDSQAYNLVTNRTTKYNGAVQLSGTKNNNENNKEKVFNFKKEWLRKKDQRPT